MCVWGWCVCGELKGAHHHQILIFCIQKDLMKHCDTQIITRRTICGTPSLCYDALQSDLKGSALICHKFWFCAYDLTHCVGRTRKKYCVDRPLVPPTWPM
jgi:hypothetical protein